MKALAVCITYGRLPYLGKMLSSFLEQTYDDKHLVVVNDDVNVQLCCRHENVSVLNCNKRLSVAEKRNLGAVYGKFDIVFPWDDDDVFFPKRMEHHIKQYEDPNVNAYRNYSCYILYNSRFCTDEGGINNKSYKKSEWYKCGGYESDGPIGEDMNLHTKLTGFKLESNPEERDFMYGFSNSNYHLSCNPKNLEEIAFKQLEKMNLVGKKFWLESDFEQYNNYLLLEEKYKRTGHSIDVEILENGNIRI
jgi:glycosyltransferase involved in cell wall biosynthesis